jgi:hypothetical protein
VKAGSDSDALYETCVRDEERGSSSASTDDDDGSAATSEVLQPVHAREHSRRERCAGAPRICSSAGKAEKDKYAAFGLEYVFS